MQEFHMVFEEIEVGCSIWGRGPEDIVVVREKDEENSKKEADGSYDKEGREGVCLSWHCRDGIQGCS